MSNRLPYAAKTLLRQIDTDDFSRDGGPDGFGVVRTLRFGKRATRNLAPIFEVMDDSRIAESHVTEAGYLYVTFVGTRHADDPAEFPLDAAREVAASQQEAPQESDQPDAPDPAE